MSSAAKLTPRMEAMLEQGLRAGHVVGTKRGWPDRARRKQTLRALVRHGYVAYAGLNAFEQESYHVTDAGRLAIEGKR